MNLHTGFSPVARALIVMAAIAIVVMFMQAAAPIMTLTLLAVFIAVVATPPLRWLQRKGLPQWGALAVIVLVLFEAGSIMGLVTTGALEGLSDSLPSYQERLILLRDQLGGWLEGIGVDNAREAVPDIFDPAAATGFVRAVLTNMSGAFTTGLLVLLAVIFMLLEAPSLQAKLITAFHLTEEARAPLRRVVSAIHRYMVIKSLTSLATARCASGFG